MRSLELSHVHYGISIVGLAFDWTPIKEQNAPTCPMTTMVARSFDRFTWGNPSIKMGWCVFGPSKRAQLVLGPLEFACPEG